MKCLESAFKYGEKKHLIFEIAFKYSTMELYNLSTKQKNRSFEPSISFYTISCFTYNYLMLDRQKVTIQDIADKANVSPSTVSRVLSGNARVVESKQTAVLEAIRELNYRPNIFARGLASGQSMTIGVLTQNISSPIYDAIMWGILQNLKGSGYSPIFADGYWSQRAEKNALHILLDRQADGLIVIGGSSPKEVLIETVKRVPLVVVGREIPEISANCLKMDDFQGGYLATHHLIERGHRQIVHITGILSHDDAVERLEGYKKALKEAGLPVDDQLIVEGEFTEQSGVMAINILMERGRAFSAVFAANDQMAFGARLALYRKGIRVPDDVSIIGYDNQPTSAYMTPPLTTIDQPAVELGEAASFNILQLIKGQAIEKTTFPAKIVMRESVSRLR